MLITNIIYSIEIFIFFASIASVVAAKKAKNKTTCNWISIIDYTYIAYMFIFMVLTDILSLPVGMEFIIFYPTLFIAFILFVVSIAISSRKAKKADAKSDNKVLYVSLAIILAPLVIVIFSIAQNLFVIQSSDVIFVYRSAGNGGIGDTNYFAYGVKQGECSRFDLGIDFDGYAIDKFLPAGAKQELLKDTDYQITLKENGVAVYKNNELVCEDNNLPSYHNNTLERFIVINH